MKRTSITIPEELYHKAKTKAENIGATFSGIVKVSLKSMLNGDDNKE